MKTFEEIAEEAVKNARLSINGPTGKEAYRAAIACMRAYREMVLMEMMGLICDHAYEPHVAMHYSNIRQHLSTLGDSKEK